MPLSDERGCAGDLRAALIAEIRSLVAKVDDGEGLNFESGAGVYQWILDAHGSLVFLLKAYDEQHAEIERLRAKVANAKAKVLRDAAAAAEQESQLPREFGFEVRRFLEMAEGLRVARNDIRAALASGDEEQP